MMEGSVEQTDSGGLHVQSHLGHFSLCRNNSKLETFLKRHSHRDVHERIHYYESCVVVSEELDKVFLHVLLTDDSIYLSEYQPRTLSRALHFSLILYIQLLSANTTPLISHSGIKILTSTVSWLFTVDWFCSYDEALISFTKYKVALL
ncbi:uncharacterized protein C12orf56-like [Clarias gariepinus]|uniref:uncharacterized protein C12orf56-like n=1 Tax=Clarias gariepinus TaxID=13013 RepID=UPI00234C866B|nr:uncharacterized protein C12orf56-like [Clarias gariepinus]